MHIKDLLNGDTRVSFEIFPPNKRVGYESVQAAVDELATLKPSFMSVTCGAGGGISEKMVDIASHIQNGLDVTALAHVTCTSFDKKETAAIIDGFRTHHVQNILALRGDKQKDAVDEAEHYQYAYELVQKIKSMGDFCIGGACYPEGHAESGTLDADVDYLKIKVDAGCDFLVTQMFFDNSLFYRYVDKMAKKNMNIPILIGVMPVTKAKQIEKMVSLSGATIPQNLQTLLDKYRDDDAEMAKAGTLFAVKQIEDLYANGFRYFHLYTMNSPSIAKGILEQLTILRHA